MSTLCQYVEPITGERCVAVAGVVAPRVEFGVMVLGDRVMLCRRHYEELWLAAMVGRPQSVQPA